MKKMNVWKAIASMVKSEGVEFIFGIGDAGLQTHAAKVSGISPIILRYEGSAPFMAMAYSRVSRKPGVCVASPGPGVANLVPGALEAFSGCSPVIIFGHAPSRKFEGRGDFQETDQVSMMRPVTKWSVRIPYADRIPWFVRRAFSIAMNGQPGPVFLELPYDVTGVSKYNTADVTLPDYVTATRLRTAGDPELITNAADMLLKAKRPVAVAGNGAILSDAGEQLMEFAELLGIPFMTTPGGRGIISEQHPLALGLCGLYRTKAGKKIYMDSDLLITIGTRNESFQTHEWADFPKGAKFIQIDISSFEIGRNWLPDIGIVGDAGIILKQLTHALKEKGAKARNYREISRVKEIVKAKDAFEKEVSAECSVKETPIPAKRIVYETSRAFGDNTIVVSENGGQDTWAYCSPYFKLHDKSEWVPVAEQTCMGMGVVGAISAKLARPEKKVVCITGDGAFQMYMKELPTATQYKVGCTWVVLNNYAFGWPKYGQTQAYGWDTSTFEAQPDFVKWAEACQCFGRRITESSEIRPALEEAMDANSRGVPAVLEFITGLDMSHIERSK
jgi:acetolactate synthase-1/2/3 large subunit